MAKASRLRVKFWGVRGSIPTPGNATAGYGGNTSCVEILGGSEQIIMETARFLGVGAASLMHTVDPTGVVFGGAMTFGGHGSQLGRRFLQAIKDEVAKRTFPVLAKETSIDFASLGGDAGYIGAAGIARLAFHPK